MIRIIFDHGPELLLLPCALPQREYAQETRQKVWETLLVQDESPQRETAEVDSLQESRLRKCQEIGLVLKQFSRTIKEESRPPKLENLRYRVMRSLKKSIRRLLQDKEVSTKGLMAMPGELEPQALSQIKEFCQLHQQALADFASLKNGPCVDHRRSGTTTGHNTYNNNYMREIFRQGEVRDAYSLYIRLLFSKDTPESLCKRFKVQCCGLGVHSLACQEKWREFKRILVDFLGAEVTIAN